MDDFTMYFGFKAGQLTSRINLLESEFKCTAFGVALESRYGKVSEVIEMLFFAKALSNTKAFRAVISANYDSKACICTISMNPNVRESVDSPIAQEVYLCAMHTIKQFEWDGGVCHGLPMQEEDYRMSLQ